MFKKTIFLLLGLSLLSLPLGATELLYFTDPAFEDFGPREQPPTLFSHDLHAKTYKVKCKKCHHVYEGGENVWEKGDPVQECSACHGGSKGELVNAYHMNCWGCHKRIKQDYPDSDTPTVDCAKCHVPEENLQAEKKQIRRKTKNKDKRLMQIIKKLKRESFY